MSKDDGGSAFPRQEQDEDRDGIAYDGMSLRDYFAGQFLTTVKISDEGTYAENVALNCYIMADAMLKERSK